MFLDLHEDADTSRSMIERNVDYTVGPINDEQIDLIARLFDLGFTPDDVCRMVHFRLCGDDKGSMNGHLTVDELTLRLKLAGKQIYTRYGISSTPEMLTAQIDLVEARASELKSKIDGAMTDQFGEGGTLLPSRTPRF